MDRAILDVQHQLSYVTFETQFNSNSWEVVQQDITDLMEQLGYDIEELCFEHIETLAQ
jgi:hypothetical protein